MPNTGYQSKGFDFRNAEKIRGSKARTYFANKWDTNADPYRNVDRELRGSLAQMLISDDELFALYDKLEAARKNEIRTYQNNGYGGPVKLSASHVRASAKDPLIASIRGILAAVADPATAVAAIKGLIENMTAGGSTSEEPSPPEVEGGLSGAKLREFNKAMGIQASAPVGTHTNSRGMPAVSGTPSQLRAAKGER